MAGVMSAVTARTRGGRSEMPLVATCSHLCSQSAGMPVQTSVCNDLLDLR